MNATAASLNSLSCGPPEVSSEQELADALHKSATHQPQQWLRGVAIILLKAMKRVTLLIVTGWIRTGLTVRLGYNIEADGFGFSTRRLRCAEQSRRVTG